MGRRRPTAVPGRTVDADPAPPAREVYLLQRTKGPQGKRLGKTTGWVHRASLKAKGVQQLSWVNYERIDGDGLHISFGPDHDRPQVLAVDNVVICAGQEPVRDLDDSLRRNGIEPHVIGGAALASRTRRQTRDTPGHRTGRPAVVQVMCGVSTALSAGETPRIPTA